MSRIIGICCCQDEQWREQAAVDMAHCCAGANDGSTSSLIAMEHATLGWVGQGESRTWSGRGVTVVLDGVLYKEDGGGIADAQQIGTWYSEGGWDRVAACANSDFAVAIHDHRERRVIVARDRLGVRPLYYIHRPGLLAFASRLKALLSLPGFSPEINHRYIAIYAASHYRYFDNRPEESPFPDIAQLPAGHVLRFANGRIDCQRYWALEDAGEDGESESDLASHYRELLLDSVKIRMARARRPAFTLSGGLDSSSVLACAVRGTGERQHAFSTVYDDATYDESSDIAPMLETSTAQWHALRIAPDDVISVIRQMVRAHDEPVATATWLSHFLLCKAAAQAGFTTLFGGLGGDELNAGEYEHYWYFFADLAASGERELLRHNVAQWSRHHDHPLYRKSAGIVDEELARLVDLQEPGRCRADRRRLERYAAALEPEFFDLRTFDPIMDHPFSSYLKNRTAQDMLRETLPCCLRAEDRQTGEFGMTNVDPFLDHRLVEFMFRLPGTVKIRDGVTKHLLRRAMEGILPEATRLRVKKTGWNAPAHRWFADQAYDDLMDLVSSRPFRERGIYKCAVVQHLAREHREIVFSGVVAENHMMFLWQVVNLELWLQELEAQRLPAELAGAPSA